MKTTQILVGLLLAVLPVTAVGAGEATKLTDLDGTTYSRPPAMTSVDVPPHEDRPNAGRSGPFYFDPANFQSALGAFGKIQKEGEDFEEAEADIGPGTVDGFDDPLDSNTDDLAFQPGDIPENIAFQSNLDAPGSSGPNPEGANALAVSTTGFLGSANTSVTANTFVNSFDILSLGPDNHTAMGMNIVSILGGTTVDVAVYDKGENLISTTTVILSGDPPTAFLGILLHTTTIGRVNIWDPATGGRGRGISDGAEGVYDLDLYLDGGVGACCDGTTGICTDGVLPGDCVGEQQAWFEDTSCAAIDCFQHAGACCDGNTGICTDGVLPGNCVGDQQTWTKDTLCADLSPPCTQHNGACCDHAQPGGACQDDVFDFECVSAQSKQYKIPAELPIPDNNPAGVRHEFFVPDPGIIADLDVDLLISHTWQGDLIITLTHKDTGTAVPILYRAGESDGTGAGFSADNLGVPSKEVKFILDDEAAEFYDSPPPNGRGNVADPGISNVTGSWIPYGSQASGLTHTLSAFDGEDKFGLWSIFVEDAAGGDLGTLHQWSLNFVNQGFGQPEWFKDLTCVDVEEQSLCDEHTGACCDNTQPGGACTDDVPESQCPVDDQHQWYKGTPCTAIVCDEHVGACCDNTQPGGACTDDVPESQCPVDDQHQWYKGTPCSAVVCDEHVGACCDNTQPGGACQDDVPESQCPVDDQHQWYKRTSCAEVTCMEHVGACCEAKGIGCSDDVPESQCPTGDPNVSWFKGVQCDELDSPCLPRRVSITDKGSLLIYSKVEIKWDAAGNVTQDTFLDIANDYPKDVFVQLYFVNGDEPTDPVFAGDPPVLIERGHSGWNWVDCQVRLTNDQTMYWSAFTGSPMGCQMFTVLDPGTPPGRPDLDGAPGSRVLRGFVYAWAVDQFGEEICWNHLKGDAVIVNYADPSAWEYNVYAARTTDACELGDAPDDEPGHMCLNGREYDACYDRLLLDFYASGSTALSGGGASVQVDTDLTLFPVDADLRQDTCGPVLTKAKFDIWNMNEIRFSGTTRCITCWDQTLLSNYDPPNHFMLGNLHTDKGKARIDGIASPVCDANDCTDCEWPKFPSCSQDAPLLGVVKKELAFSGGATGRAAAGMTLVGMGEESTCIWYDIIEPPEELVAPGGDLVGPPSGVGDLRKASSVSPR